MRIVAPRGAGARERDAELADAAVTVIASPLSGLGVELIVRVRDGVEVAERQQRPEAEGRALVGFEPVDVVADRRGGPLPVQDQFLAHVEEPKR